MNNAEIAFPKFELIFSKVKIAALKYTTLKAKNNPDIKPTIVVFENKLLKNSFKSFTDNRITPSVEIIIPLIPNLFNFSFNIKYSNKATCITSVLLRDVPTTKFEKLNKYNNMKVKII